MKNIPGKKSLSVFNEEQNYISPGTQGIALYSKIALAKGKNAFLYDEDGNRYIDFVAGIGVDPSAIAIRTMSRLCNRRLPD